ncbi:MAG: EAL domain-containing protein, partial [Leptospira sp.]|nr:EAL domain-containing protein [Leptospira sp.]
MSEVLDLGKIKASHKDWLEFIKSGKVLPYFQPIVSLESCSVFGYEALGRIEFPGGRIESLGSFFGARIESQEFFELQKKIDLEIRALSMRFLLEDPNRESKLFINISPLTMMSELRELEKEIPFTIRQSRELGIQSSRIIIEMTEGSFNFNPEVVRPLIETYRAEGFLIAIDDVGSESSNLDRIGLFHPDIIKVDLQLLRRSVLHRSFQEIIQTLSVLSESLGSSLIFEGIETEEELYKAMSSGSRYLQGFIFAKAREDFAKEMEFQEQLSPFLSLFYTRKIQEIKD